MICSRAEFKKLDINDLSTIMSIERDAFILPWSAAMMRDSLLAAHTNVYGLFSEEGDMIGFVVFSIVLDEAELLSMAISPEYQNQGYGRILLEYVIKHVKKKRADSIFLEVRRSNTRALSLYQKEGFHIIGERKQYYPSEQGADKREDAVLLAYQIK